MCLNWTGLGSAVGPPQIGLLQTGAAGAAEDRSQESHGGWRLARGGFRLEEDLERRGYVITGPPHQAQNQLEQKFDKIFLNLECKLSGLRWPPQGLCT